MRSPRTGIFRAEPKAESVLKLAALSCHKDIGWPWKEAIDELIAHDPDLVFFSGDQIYENDYGSRMFRAVTEAEVPKGMKNYLEKWRKFGEAFRELMRNRPTIMITDDHDVFANDLWGKGGLRMQGIVRLVATPHTQHGLMQPSSPRPVIYPILPTQDRMVMAYSHTTPHLSMVLSILQFWRTVNSRAHHQRSSRS